ncbi:TraB/GumN family protein [Lysobacter humi (ex Lee et al. 2017)]
MRLFFATAVSIALLASAASHAQAPPAPAAERVLDSAVVRGVVPGPGLWKVRKGENTLYILGLQSPLPKRMDWNAGRVRAVIAKANEVIGEPSISVGSDLGFFAKMALVPSLLKMGNNPEGKKLKDMVPAASYARWLVLKRRYLGSGNGVEKKRPMVAANELFMAAIRKSGLDGPERVQREIDRAVKKRGLKPTSPRVEIKIADIKGAVRDLRAAHLADLDCFEKTLDRLETDVGAMRLRANAWATGDIARLRALQRPDQFEACKNAILKSALAEKYGIDDAETQARQKWLAAAESALRRNRVTFATLRMRDLLGSGGALATLAARGYVVEEPAPPSAAAP